MYGKTNSCTEKNIDINEVSFVMVDAVEKETYWTNPYTKTVETGWKPDCIMLQIELTEYNDKEVYLVEGMYYSFTETEMNDISIYNEHGLRFEYEQYKYTGDTAHFWGKVSRTENGFVVKLQCLGIRYRDPKVTIISMRYSEG